MSTDFNKCLKKIGLKPKRELPVYNRTKKLSTNQQLTYNIVNKITTTGLGRATIYLGSK